jgi:hypothetical protein
MHEAAPNEFAAYPQPSWNAAPAYELLTVPNVQDRLHVRRELLAQVRLLVPVLRRLAKQDRPASQGARELIELVGGEA